MNQHASAHSRAAIIGTGFIAAVHRDGLVRNGIEIVGVLGSSPVRGEDAAGRWGVPKAYHDLGELLHDDSVDVVHITSPNAQHREQALAVIAAGKHVICEKPLAATATETEELLRAVLDAGVVHAVNYNVRHYPLVQEARARVAAGMIGRPNYITGQYLQDWLLLDTDWNWRVAPDDGSRLRALADIGSHWFDLTSFVLDSPIVEVLAETMTVHPVRYKPAQSSHAFSASDGPTEPVSVSTDDAATVLLKYGNGVRGSVAVSQVAAGRKNHVGFEVAGSSASLAWNGERPDEMWIGHRERPNEILQRDPSLLLAEGARTSRIPGGHAEGFENTFADLYRRVYSHIADGGVSSRPADYATFLDGHHEALVLAAVEQSARTRSWAAVDYDA